MIREAIKLDNKRYFQKCSLSSIRNENAKHDGRASILNEKLLATYVSIYHVRQTAHM